jgi:transcriptional/translational regulatory protein YebC/TACO1
LGEIKSILNQNNGKMAGEGAVRWMFKRKGVITISGEGKSKEDLEMLAIELGADDIKSNDANLDIYTKVEDFESVKKALEEKGIKIEGSALDYIPKEEVEISEKDKIQAEKLFEALDENDAVNDIYSNQKN